MDCINNKVPVYFIRLEKNLTALSLTEKYYSLSAI